MQCWPVSSSAVCPNCTRLRSLLSSHGPSSTLSSAYLRAWEEVGFTGRTLRALIANALPFHSHSLLSFAHPGGFGFHPWQFFRSSYHPSRLSLPLSARSFLRSGFAMLLSPSLLRQYQIGRASCRERV